MRRGGEHGGGGGGDRTHLLQEVLYDPLLRDMGPNRESVLQLTFHFPHLLLVPLRCKPLSTYTTLPYPVHTHTSATADQPTGEVA